METLSFRRGPKYSRLVFDRLEPTTDDSLVGPTALAMLAGTKHSSRAKNVPVYVKPGKDQSPLLTRSSADDNRNSHEETDVTNNNERACDVSNEAFEKYNGHKSSRSSHERCNRDKCMDTNSDVILADNANSVTRSQLNSDTTDKSHISSQAEIPPKVLISRSPHLPLPALTMNLSFAGCGFLGMYHLGVVHAMASHGHKLLLNVQRFGGASAGSLIASAMAVWGPDLDIIQECVDFCLSMAADVHKKRLGVLTPRLSLLDPLDEFLTRMFPEDAHIRASGRLFISVTDARTKKNHVMSEFTSKEQLIKYLLGSSYVPFVTGSRPVKVDGKKFLDGGMTNNLPEPPSGRTIFITPFSGRQHICPHDKEGRGWYTHIQGEDFQVNSANLKRGLHAFFPPKRKHLEKYFDRGRQDAIRFLKEENFYSESSLEESEITESTRL